MPTTYNPTMHQKQMEGTNKTNNDQLQAVWFAAGVAVMIACLERATVLSIFKNWHMWVFLALNLLLIAILFTSRYPPKNTSNLPPKSHSGQDSVKTAPPDTVDNDGENEVKVNEVKEIKENGFDVKEEETNDFDDEKCSNLLSNDELNEKVEAFILRFRQQYLVSDVKIRRRSENVDVYARAVISKTITV